jgi:hypothetical protein
MPKSAREAKERAPVTVEELEARIRAYADLFGKFLIAELRLFGATSPAAVRVVTAETIYRLLDYIEAFRVYRSAEIAFLTPSKVAPALEDQSRRAVEQMYAKIAGVCESEESFRLSKLLYSAALVDGAARPIALRVT